MYKCSTNLFGFTDYVKGDFVPWFVDLSTTQPLNLLTRTLSSSWKLVDVCCLDKVLYYSTVVQIVSCTLSSDSVLWESTGLFNPVLSGPVWFDQNQIWILKSGSWNHGVVIKQNVKSESGFLKTNAKSGSSFYPDVEIYQFYPYEFYQNVVVLFP